MPIPTLDTPIRNVRAPSVLATIGVRTPNADGVSPSTPDFFNLTFSSPAPSPSRRQTPQQEEKEQEKEKEEQPEPRHWPAPRSPLPPHRLAKLANALGVSTPLPAFELSGFPSPSLAPPSPIIPPSPSVARPSTPTPNPPVVSRFFVHVLPPRYLPHHSDPRAQPADYLAPPPTNASGYHVKFRRGVLVGVQPTLPSQLAAIAREYGLPSTRGIVLYLVNADGNSTEEGDGCGPRLTDDVWRTLWARVVRLEEDRFPEDSDRTQQSFPRSPLARAGTPLSFRHSPYPSQHRPLLASPFLTSNFPSSPSFPPRDGARSAPPYQHSPSQSSSFPASGSSSQPSREGTASSTSTESDLDTPATSADLHDMSSAETVGKQNVVDLTEDAQLPRALLAPLKLHARGGATPTQLSFLPIIAHVEFHIDPQQATWYKPWVRSRRRNASWKGQEDDGSRKNSLPVVLSPNEASDDKERKGSLPTVLDGSEDGKSRRKRAPRNLRLRPRQSSRLKRRSLLSVNSAKSDSADGRVESPDQDDDAWEDDPEFDPDMEFDDFYEQLWAPRQASSASSGDRKSVQLSYLNEDEEGRRRVGVVFDELDLGLDASGDYEEADDDDPYDRRKSQIMMKAKLDEIERTLQQLSPNKFKHHEELPYDPEFSNVSSLSPNMIPGAPKYNRDVFPPTPKLGPSMDPPLSPRSTDSAWPAVPFSALASPNGSPRAEDAHLSPDASQSGLPRLAVNGVTASAPPGFGENKANGAEISAETAKRRKLLEEQESLYPSKRPDSSASNGIPRPNSHRSQSSSSSTNSAYYPPPRKSDDSPIIPLSPDPFGRSDFSGPGSAYWENPERQLGSGNTPMVSIDERMAGGNGGDPEVNSSRFSADSLNGDEKPAKAAPAKESSQRTTMMSVRGISKLWRKSNKASVSQPAPPMPQQPVGRASSASASNPNAGRASPAASLGRSPSAGATSTLSQASSRAATPARPERPSQELVDLPDVPPDQLGRYSTSGRPSAERPSTESLAPPMTKMMMPNGQRSVDLRFDQESPYPTVIPRSRAASNAPPPEDPNGMRKSILKSKGGNGSISEDRRQRRPSLSSIRQSLMNSPPPESIPPSPKLPEQFAAHARTASNAHVRSGSRTHTRVESGAHTRTLSGATSRSGMSTATSRSRMTTPTIDEGGEAHGSPA
ncbi:uncharacterized protein SCHCODRAFT_02172609 [Schizophyllum commune H4-8]|nr:uncharacterized protein SCHCODRAFT_02172609 [Schizophyllum commune H4-8]KAI5898738.1 hypothetical protein SCHCODRAFT_02172609 [Schizophyllum commune H4-8]